VIIKLQSHKRTGKNSRIDFALLRADFEAKKHGQLFIDGSQKGLLNYKLAGHFCPAFFVVCPTC
jgi:hypothetical protein